MLMVVLLEFYYFVGILLFYVLGCVLRYGVYCWKLLKGFWVRIIVRLGEKKCYYYIGVNY